MLNTKFKFIEYLMLFNSNEASLTKRCLAAGQSKGLPGRFVRSEVRYIKLLTFSLNVFNRHAVESCALS